MSKFCIVVSYPGLDDTAIKDSNGIVQFDTTQEAAAFMNGIRFGANNMLLVKRSTIYIDSLEDREGPS